MFVANFQGEGKPGGKDFVLFTGAHTKHCGLCAWKWMSLLPALLISPSFLRVTLFFIIRTLLAGLFYKNYDVCSRVTVGHNCALNRM
jgi:hypothetical protein